MTESTIRYERKRGFTVVRNGMLGDPRLSLKTKGLFAVMLSKPGSWQFSVGAMAREAGVGRDAIRSCLKELREAGYLTVEKQSHGAHGKFGGSVYLLHDESCTPWPDFPSTAEPSTAEPSTAEPLTENPTQVNTDLVNTDPVKTDPEENDPPIAPQGAVQAPVPEEKKRTPRRAVKTVPAWEPERFEGFWAYYPCHKNRARAAAEWDRLRPDGALIREMGLALQWQKASEEWQRGIGIPYACRWLKDKRWLDEPPEPPDASSWALQSGVRTW